MHVHRSNRVEHLANALAEVVARPLASPLTAETIVVQSRGMERWLSIRLAEHFGVWAGARFPFPRAFVDEVFAAVVGRVDVADTSGANPFARERLRFWIARLLDEHRAVPEFAAIARYLGSDPAGHKQLQLAARIADVFDEYVVYRPDEIRGWQNGEGEGWQPQLWRSLVEHLGDEHTASRAARFFEKWGATRSAALGSTAFGSAASGVPERISVFGVSTLPPLYLEVLEALSHQVEVHLFLLSPSQEHTAEIRSQREILRELRRSGGTNPDAVHLSEGHPLLASLGRVDREFQQVLERACPHFDAELDHYTNPGTDTALHTIQSDILYLRHRGPGKEVAPRVLDGDDTSVSIHVCHSPTREIEVLRDQLRALFESDPTLAPQDVVVMAPDIEVYAPLVEATFGRERSDPLNVPYCIADRSHRSTSAVIEAVLAVLSVLQGRLAASEVIDLLHHEPVRARFGIATEELPIVTRWVREAGIRWGTNAEDRLSQGQPEHDINTWEFGLRRLLLGYAMPGADRELFAKTLPYDDVEGSAADLLGRLAQLCDCLFARRREVQETLRLPEWVAPLELLLSSTIAVEPHAEWEVQLVRDAIRSLGERAEEAALELAVPIEVVQALLVEALEADRSAWQFLSGGVTFCSMLPMRSIPFRVVCLLGMNDGEFPRLQHRVGFDRMATELRAGDRSLRDEDRYLFLEALLSARDRLLGFYVGRSVQDNSVLPPSVVLGEFLDVLEESFQTKDQASQQGLLFGQPATRVFDVVRTEHPLQPFSPRYFSGKERLFSFDAAAAAGARALVDRTDDQPRFVMQPLPPPELPAGQSRPFVSLEQLAAFLENPARSLLKGRFGLNLDDRPNLVPDREPLQLDALEHWQLGTALLDQLMTSEEDAEAWVERAYEQVQARGVLPPGTPGRCVFDDLVPSVRALAALARRSAQGARLAPVDLDVEVRATRLHGVLRDLWSEAQVRWSYSRVRAKSELVAWVTHLALQCVPEVEEAPRRTVLVGRGPTGAGVHQVSFAPLGSSDAERRLAELLELFHLGQRVPLPFFPNASRRYVENRLRLPQGRLASLSEEEIEHRALHAAREAYLPADYSRQRGEAEDPYVAKLFGELDPIGLQPNQSFQPFTSDMSDAPDLSFTEVARVVFEPLFAAMEVEE